MKHMPHIDTNGYIEYNTRRFFHLKRSSAIKKEVPFAVNKNDSRSLVSQVADGLRQGIVGGFYQPNEVIPSYRDLATILGVSQIVTKAALRMIADEGLVVSRPRIGSVVCNPGTKRWRGHVLTVCPGGDENYVETVLASTLRDKLVAADYHFTLVNVPYTFSDGFDFSSLDVALAQSVDLIVTISPRPEMLAYLAKQKVPYVVFDECKKSPHGAVGHTRLSYALAMPDFAAACKTAGVKEVVQLYFWPTMGVVSPALRKVGLHVRTVLAKVDVSEDGLTLIAIKRAGMEAMAKLLAKGPLPRDTVIFVTDDYLASGALMAIAYAGLKVPEDIRLVTFANKRLGPVYPRELTRMEFDAREAGEVLSAAVLEYLETGVYPMNSVVRPIWIEGETMTQPGKVSVWRNKKKR